MSTKEKRPHTEGASANRLGGPVLLEANYAQVKAGWQIDTQDALMSHAKPLLTVEDFNAWRRVNVVALEEAEAKVREALVDALLRNVLQHSNWGEQAACRNAWRCIGRHQPHALKALAEETLIGIGWQRKRKGAAE